MHIKTEAKSKAIGDSFDVDRVNEPIALTGRGIRKTFVRDNRETVLALDDVSLEVHRGTLAALVGPDGAGKTTLIRLAAGLLPVDRGELQVLGLNVSADTQQVQDRIGYMPQKFGLYEDLRVQENLDLYADLHGISIKDRQEVYPRLMDMPMFLQYVTLINPLRYAIDIAHRVYLEGVGLALLVPELWPLAVIAAITLSAASWMFRHRLA